MCLPRQILTTIRLYPPKGLTLSSITCDNVISITPPRPFLEQPIELFLWVQLKTQNSG
ncbi:uncharacterized protein PHALS_09404 [Plasmopara halstedii]|uniref:Uncharacterized protein n=1 Tax=Plasmopara halstedii TaxID=4781 RepID=A0A0P1A5B4_PLAHL|nr:uncharacterized protein PHALS_09404 [Plasmopara halstedii]CEG35277.1 hypothetical protein PHALS_09404 [Plasmopara halstedii]|eukprot:XP_024571646.1 hypothetical protein PHALS_09404 [Plasmopara halstedii]